ncbi:MAG: hypothetical protein AB7V32_08870, partial [Candidatus Berkiella sp.]
TLILPVHLDLILARPILPVLLDLIPARPILPVLLDPESIIAGPTGERFFIGTIKNDPLCVILIACYTLFLPVLLGYWSSWATAMRNEAWGINFFGVKPQKNLFPRDSRQPHFACPFRSDWL